MHARVAVNPIARTLEVYRLDAGQWVRVDTHGGDETVRGAVRGSGARSARAWSKERPPSAP
jgi:hypothetical protein